MIGSKKMSWVPTSLYTSSLRMGRLFHPLDSIRLDPVN